MKKQLLSLLGLLVIGTSAMAQVPSYVPSNGLVGWWPFNGNANDEGGNGNNGSVSEAMPTNDRNGNPNAAYSFDGVNDLIDYGNITSLNGQSALTISVWFKSSGNVFYSRILGKELDQDDQNGFTLQYSTNNGSNLRVNMRNNANVQGDNSTLTIVNDQWYHAVIVFDGNGNTDSDKLKLYVDGTEVLLAYSGTLPSSTSTNTYPFYVGNMNGSITESPWHGDIDDIGIWNVALTQEEVTELYEAVDGPCLVSSAVSFVGLDANYSLSDGSATLVGSPAGGAFFGEGVSAGQFDPSAAGVGTHSIVYTYVDENGCVGSYGLCTTVDVGVNIEGVNMGIDGSIDVYPNPSKGQYNISLENIEGMVELNVVDVRGREVYNRSMVLGGQRSVYQIDLSGFANGVYTLSIRTANGSKTQKLIKE